MVQQLLGSSLYTHSPVPDAYFSCWNVCGFSVLMALTTLRSLHKIYPFPQTSTPYYILYPYILPTVLILVCFQEWHPWTAIITADTLSSAHPYNQHGHQWIPGQSRKEPGFFLRVHDDPLPSLAIESGWSESWNNLVDDMNLLLVGGAGTICTVVILNWQLNHTTRSVSGFTKLYVHNGDGLPSLARLDA